MTSPSLTNRRYAILGTGALGGFYGARLQQAGADVHFLLRSDYEHVRHHGLMVQSPDGDFALPSVNAYPEAQTMPACEVVVVALKTTQNYLLPNLLSSVLKPNGVVVLLQNGLGMEAQVADIVGADRVIGGLCFICSNKVAPGHIHHLDYKKIVLGEYGVGYRLQAISDRLHQIAADFEQAGIPIELTEDLCLARWQKLVWNIPFNGLSVVLNAQTDQMMANPQVRQLATQLMAEVLAGAAGCDRLIPPTFIDEMVEHTAKMKPYRTSMKIDYDERRPLELEAIFANPLRMARQAKVELPRIEMLYQQLQFLDQQNRPNDSLKPS